MLIRPPHLITGTLMTGNPRHDELLKLVNETGYVSVEDLSEKFEVSTQTIRRDIKKLSNERLLVRHHGGAGRSSSVVNLEYSLRQSSETQEKEAIATEITNYISDNCTIFLTIGTTTEIIAKYLLRRKGIRIITNSMKVASILYGNQDFEVMVPGGILRAHNGGIVGPATLEFVKRFRVDYLITSVGSIDSDGTLLDYDYSEVAIVKSVMKNARSTLIAADSTKFSTTAAVELASIRDTDVLFTDQIPSEPLKTMLKLHDVTVKICR